MKLRWLTAMCVLVLAAPLAAHAQGARATAPGGPQPSIEITTTVHDFGDIYKQEKYVHAFLVHNKGNADLVIEEVKPG